MHVGVAVKKNLSVGCASEFERKKIWSCVECTIEKVVLFMTLTCASTKR
jgi:hypothetical protein